VMTHESGQHIKAMIANIHPIFLSYPVATASGSLVLGTKARILSAI
jgi:hypothetical protein